jgi:hypothetical protein
MNRFGSTGLVPAKVDREVDPYTHIDRVRGEVYDLIERQQRLEGEVQALKNAETARVTESGVFRLIKQHSDHEIARWVKWGIRISGGCIITGMLTTVGWFIVWVVKGALHR